LVLTRPDDSRVSITVADLGELPQHSIVDCYIVSTGHGTSGPFRFEGVTLADLLGIFGIATWSYANVISADGFGTRVYPAEIAPSESAGTLSSPILLALACNGKALTREQGLVRLIVPQEHDDALRQVKWVASIEVH
jgi:DMSO/TMAO reductase YedYZ molybdopterin-dependent catalytic subunit